MLIREMRTEDVPGAAQMFAVRLEVLRRMVPALPARLEDRRAIEEKLNHLLEVSGGFVAEEAGRMVGYLGAYIIPEFRGTQRTGAYVPEWGHSVEPARQDMVYRRLYRAASARWTELGCEVHSLSLLANDDRIGRTWVWNGFGVAVIDAIRGVDPIQPEPVTDLTIRPAELSDVDLLAEIEAEHWQHYRKPPIFMAPHAPDDAAAFAKFLQQPASSAWLALDKDRLAGYLRFEGQGDGAAAIVAADDGFHCTGAYVRPAYRGRRAAPALLDAAIRAYARAGYRRASVDFESFNPEAVEFWLKYYTPVSFGMLRIPECVG